MDNLTSWNVRGLNWPNKQAEVKLFLQSNKVGLVGLLETKVKVKNIEKVAASIFHGWNWVHNFSLNATGRIWVAWHPRAFDLEVLHLSEQFIHCRVIQLSTQRKFTVAFVYGFNQEHLRGQLWSDLFSISQNMTDAWCILGDFNTILYKEDRFEGDAITDHDIRELQNCINQCELHEMPNSGAYYSWTNKSIWSRIDRLFINGYWHSQFNYTHAKYMASGFSYHSPLLVHFPSSFKPQNNFPVLRYVSIIESTLPKTPSPNKIEQLWNFLTQLKPLLRRLNRDSNGDPVENFEQVDEMMVKFYRSLLGTHINHRTPLRKEVLEAGPMLSLEQQVGLCRPFTDQEIKSAPFFIPNNKSPSPDGYNSGFFKPTWTDRPHGLQGYKGILQNRSTSRTDYQLNSDPAGFNLRGTSRVSSVIGMKKVLNMFSLTALMPNQSGK
ncbi:hypothetical protein Cgig2_030899 [Carnegiea gigantea]|uniref:Endonuclease/exonuclease/phosphatase domain-containing protein n=1 Tax=Carnegiea gigantea TaxID=171969 RepID=A0A9Q1GIV3_9CARY|nr:hypothetical protein Cgig2_030899 [Carnegiea gigantea]